MKLANWPELLAMENLTKGQMIKAKTIVVKHSQSCADHDFMFVHRKSEQYGASCCYLEKKET